MAERTLIWADMHNRTLLIKKFLERHGSVFTKRVFLADFWDQFGDTAYDARETAIVVRELLEDTRNVLLYGNHDISYRFPIPGLICPGYSVPKHRAIQSIITEDHWEKLKLCHLEQGWLCSHAGVSPDIFGHPVHGLQYKRIEEDCEKAIEMAKAKQVAPALIDAEIQPLNMQHRGITWLRWDNMPVVQILHAGQPIQGQIVGHTIYNSPRVAYARKKFNGYTGKEAIKTVEKSLSEYVESPPKRADKLIATNWNIDCNNAFYAIISDGKLTVHETDQDLLEECSRH